MEPTCLIHEISRKKVLRPIGIFFTLTEIIRKSGLEVSMILTIVVLERICCSL